MLKKRKLYPITPSIMLLAGTSAVSAQEVEQGFYIAPSAGYYTYDSDNNNQVDDAPFYGISLGLQFNKNWAIEASYFRLDTEVKPETSNRAVVWSTSPGGGVITRAEDGKYYPEGDDVEVNMYRINGIFSLGLAGGFSPYVAVGYTKLDQDPQFGEKDDMMDVALGVKKSLSSGLFIRGDVRALHSWDNEDTDYSASLGLGYLFGKATGPAPTPVEQPQKTENDADGDGVADNADLCPDTPPNTAVDKNGCPDSDRDGVPDHQDACPNTPAGETVDEKGCPVGLPKGAGEEVSITLEVLFDTNKAIVKPEYLPDIQKVADFMRQYPNTTADIEGHTDSRGSNALNKRLSQRRADAVRQMLTSKFGIEASRLRAVGYGEERPIADNKTDDGRRKNRRVVAVLRAMTAPAQQ